MSKYFNGWKLTQLISLFLLLHFILASYYLGLDKPSVGYLIRSTARFSFVLFMLTFSASSLIYFWKNRVTKWIMANRRYLGVSFAVSHYLHLIALLMMTYSMEFNVFDSRGLIPGLIGVVAYSFITIMVVTSFNKGRKLLSTKNWNRVHTTGGYLFWIIFAKSYLLRFPENFWTILFSLILIFVMVIRILKLLTKHQSVRA